MSGQFPMVGRAVLAAHEAGIPAPSVGALMIAAAAEVRYSTSLSRLIEHVSSTECQNVVAARCAERLIAALGKEAVTHALDGGAG